jgi:peptidoglycan/LPS O-acetylase OafA/YrhL
MSTVVLVLMIISVALAAYAKGRREGTWSWPLFFKTLLGIWVLGAGAGILGIWLGRRMGPEHALLATGMTVLVIVAGVVALALWLRGKMSHGNP